MIRFIVLVLVAASLVSCDAPPVPNQYKITQGDRVWYTCDLSYGEARIFFRDRETGKEVMLQGSTLVEETDLPCGK